MSAPSETLETSVPSIPATEQAGQAPISRGLDFVQEPEALPALPESRPDSPEPEVLAPVAGPLEPLIEQPEEPAAETSSRELEFENLPALPDSRPSSPAEIELTPSFTMEPSTSLPTTELVTEDDTLAQERSPFEDLEKLPVLPESRPDSPLAVEPSFASVTEPSISLVGTELVTEDTTPALEQSFAEDLEKLPSLPESRPGSPAEIELTPTPVIEPSTSLLPAEAVAAEITPTQEWSSVADLETLPALPESRPASPAAIERPATPTTEPSTSLLPAEVVAEDTTPARERSFEDLEKLPSLPESRPSSPVEIELPVAPTSMLLPAEDTTSAQDRGPIEDSAELPALPESRPDSPVVADIAPVEVVDFQPTIEQTVSTQDQDFKLNSDELPPLPESRPDSPVQKDAEFVEVVESQPAGGEIAEERSLEHDLTGLPALPESRPDSPVQRDSEPVEVVKSEPVDEDMVQERSSEQDLTGLPALPESRPDSPVQRDTESVEAISSQPTQEEVAQDQIPEQDLTVLPALPESRPSSPAHKNTDLVEVVNSAGEDVAGEPSSEPDLAALPALPESRPDTPTQLPTSPAVLPEPSTAPVSEGEETPVSRTFEPSFSQESTIQERDFAEQPLEGSRSGRFYQPSSTYEELKNAGFQKRIPSPPVTRGFDKQGWEAPEKSKSNLLGVTAGAAGAAAASGVLVAHMRHDDSQPDLQRLEYDKLQTPSYDRAESVYSFNEDASTVAASEAPTYLSGSTFYESQPDSGKSDEAPPKPGTLAYLLSKRGQKYHNQEDEWATARAPSLAPLPEVQDNRDLGETPTETNTGQSPIVAVEEKEEAEPQTLQRTSSTRKKGKKKSSKEVSWTESQAENQQQSQASEPHPEHLISAPVAEIAPVDEVDATTSDQPQPTTTAETSTPDPAGPTDKPPTDKPEGHESTPAPSKKSKKKKKAKKGDSSLEPKEDPQPSASVLETRDIAGPDSSGLTSGSGESHSTAPLQEIGLDSAAPRHVEPRELLETDAVPPSSGEVAVVRETPRDLTTEQDPESRPVSPAAAGAGPEQDEEVSRSLPHADVTPAKPAEPIKPKTGMWGPSFRMFPSMAGGVGSLFGRGRGQFTQEKQHQEAEKREAEVQPEPEASRDAFPMQDADQQQHGNTAASLEPTFKSPPPPPSLGESSSQIPDVGRSTGVHEPPDSNKSGVDTARDPADTAVWLPNDHAPAPGIPTLDPVDETAPLPEVARLESDVVGNIDEIRGVTEDEQPDKTARGSPGQSQGLTTSDDAQQLTVDAPVAADDGVETAGAMDKKGEEQEREDMPERDEPAPQDSALAPRAVAEASQQDPLAEPQANPGPIVATEPSSVTDQDTDQETSAEHAAKKKKQAAAEAEEVPVVEPASEPAAPETAPEPPVDAVEEQSAPSETVVEAASAEAPQVESQAEPAPSSKKGKKKKKKQASQDAAEASVEASTEQSTPAPVEEPKPAPTLDSLQPEAPSAQTPSVEDAQTPQGDANPQPDETQEPATGSKKSKKKKKKKRASLAVETETPETTAPPSTAEDAVPAPVTADEQPSNPGDNTSQDSPFAAPDADDAPTTAKGKDNKKKRQSVSFAEPLEEHLGSSNARGEDDNNQKTQDSKDSISDVPTVPPQSGDSVVERPAQAETQSPSTQVGVTVPLLDARDVPGAGSDVEPLQEPAPLSRFLGQPADNETSHGIGMSDMDRDQQTVASGESQQLRTEETLDESESSRDG
jgi:hypothetical protein